MPRLCERTPRLARADLQHRQDLAVDGIVACKRRGDDVVDAMDAHDLLTRSALPSMSGRQEGTVTRQAFAGALDAEAGAS